MKRLILIASLCVAAAVVAPIASASAATFTGKCTIKGEAKFGGATLTKTLQTNLKYTFEDKEKEAVCVEESGTVREGRAEVKGGVFEGSCTGEGKSTTDGEGALRLKNPTATYEFKLAFTSNNGIVSLKIKNAAGTETAKGEANFAASIKEPAAQCLTTGVGELEFVAKAEGTIGE